VSHGVLSDIGTSPPVAHSINLEQSQKAVVNHGRMRLKKSWSTTSHAMPRQRFARWGSGSADEKSVGIAEYVGDEFDGSLRISVRILGRIPKPEI